jgi:hypothetical protein
MEEDGVKTLNKLTTIAALVLLSLATFSVSAQAQNAVNPKAGAVKAPVFAAPALLAPAGPILFFKDSEQGDDVFDDALDALGLGGDVTFAGDAGTFAELLGSQDWGCVIALNQNNRATATFAAGLTAHVSGGGRAIFTDWTINSSGQTALYDAFGVAGTGTTNQEPITTDGHPFWTGVPSEVSLANPGWGIWTMGLATVGGGAGTGTFPNGDSAVVVGNGGATAFNGFLSDTFSLQAEGIQVAVNQISEICLPEGNALFKVTKTFSDGNDAEVDVMLTCNTGLPLQQDFTIAGGDPDGVTFVVTDIPDGGADCEVTETGTPAGYTAVLNGGAGCEWEDVTGGLRVCAITNEANPATYPGYKDWTVYREGGDVVVGEADVTIECDSAIVGGDEDDGTWTLSGTLSDGETLVATVDTTEGAATCSASEEVTQSGVESVSVGCDETSLAAGGSHTCTFTNTVFFEGIPTLSQYGLAILVLLTLGVGFIGFRRFA